MPLLSRSPLTACSDSDSDNDDNGFRLTGCADDGSCASNPTLTIGGERPSMVQIPSDYDINTRYPLVMVLHGRGVDGWIQSLYLGLVDKVDSLQFVLVYPDGLSLGGRKQRRQTSAMSVT